jgi:hypothetical protein
MSTSTMIVNKTIVVITFYQRMALVLSLLFQDWNVNCVSPLAPEPKAPVSADETCAPPI